VETVNDLVKTRACFLRGWFDKEPIEHLSFGISSFITDFQLQIPISEQPLLLYKTVN
jgi:hypothetical protein